MALAAISERGRVVLAVALLVVLALVVRGPDGAMAATATSFTASADAYVSQAQPAKRFGGLSELRAQAPPGEFRSYLRFDVQGLPAGTVTRATLRVRPNGLATAYAAHSVGLGNWAESSITWNKAPPLGAAVGSSVLGGDGWTTVDVSSLVSANGTLSLALTSASTSLVSLASRETGANAPRLVVETTSVPKVTLTSPANGTSANDPTPTFGGAAGTAPGDSSTVTVRVYAGTSASGTPVQTLSATQSAGAWSVTPSTSLADGTYTANAQQANTDGSVGTSTPSTFSVDGAAPPVTLTAPADGSTTTSATPTFSGAAGAAAGDSQTVTVDVYAGALASGTPVQTQTASRSGSAWSVVSAALAAGQYTARAEQTDLAGNVGSSAPSTFTVPVAPPATGYRSAVLADGPQAYWRLGEPAGATTAVSETSSNDATYVNAVTLGLIGALAGDTNTAASLDGINDHLTAPDASALDFTAGATIEAWVKRSKASAYQVIVGKPGNGQSKFENYALWLNTSNQLVGYFGNGTSYASVASSVALDTRWHHVVTTYDNATAKLYIDGALNASSTSSVRLTANALALNVGRAADNSYFYGGLADEVAVYSGALSADAVGRHYSTGAGTVTVGPAVTLRTPESGSSTADSTPAFAGQAGLASADSSTVTVKLHEGSTTGGALLQTLTTTRAASGSWTVDASAPLALGTYTAQAQQADSSGTIGHSATQTFSVTTRAAVGSDAELVGAGDIAYCAATGDEATAALLDGFPSATVFTLGDNAYESGTASEYANCYGPTWGRAKARTLPSLGDHDYADGGDPSAAGYFGYFSAQLAPFGAEATDPNRGYYSYDIGSWHVTVLNALCGGAASGCNVATQLTWLQNDLAAHPASCTLALLSAPRFSSGSIHGNNSSMGQYWDRLYAAGVDLVLGGDDHDYERFAPQDPLGAYDPNGLRQIVVGTGGRSHYPFSTVRANSEVRNDTTFGVLRLVLRPGSYDWEFVPEAGKSFVDAGSDGCH